MKSYYNIITLYSGSAGNATYIRVGQTELLIDAGKSARTLCASLKAIGTDISHIRAVFLTHEHSDHTKALEMLTKKMPLPIHTTRGSAPGVCADPQNPLYGCLCTHPPIFTEQIGEVRLTSFPTPHDSRESVGYRLEFEDDEGISHKIGYVTDIGCVTAAIRENILGCESVVLECNHDPEMLWAGRYPAYLKERIYSRYGHLSNPDCAAFCAELAQNGTRHIMLAHLSRENNLPELAYQEVRGALADDSITLQVAAPDRPVALFADDTPAEADTSEKKGVSLC